MASFGQFLGYPDINQIYFNFFLDTEFTTDILKCSICILYEFTIMVQNKSDFIIHPIDKHKHHYLYFHKPYLYSKLVTKK